MFRNKKVDTPVGYVTSSKRAFHQLVRNWPLWGSFFVENKDKMMKIG